MLYGRRFPLRLKGAVYRSYVGPAILYRSEVWCLKNSEIRILRKTDRSMIRAMCGVQLKDRNGSIDLMFLLGEPTDDELKLNNISVGYGKQCSLMWSCIDV